MVQGGLEAEVTSIRHSELVGLKGNGILDNKNKKLKVKKAISCGHDYPSQNDKRKNTQVKTDH